MEGLRIRFGRWRSGTAAGSSDKLSLRIRDPSGVEAIDIEVKPLLPHPSEQLGHGGEAVTRSSVCERSYDAVVANVGSWRIWSRG